MTSTLQDLREIVARLRAPDGCPWDREQTPQSLIPSLIEELYEVIDTLDRADYVHLREELGDLLLHIVLQVQMAEEKSLFTFEEVIAELCEKLIRRHPHVFGDVPAGDSTAVLKQWDEIKRAEKGGIARTQSLLASVPRSFPALLRAAKLQHKAAKVGFDWPDAEPVYAKIDEEIAEVRAASITGDSRQIEDEIGDTLFSVVNLARKLNIDPELALQRASDKFAGRFAGVEALARERNLSLHDLDLAALDSLWDEVKQKKHVTS